MPPLLLTPEGRGHGGGLHGLGETIIRKGIPRASAYRLAEELRALAFDIGVEE